MSPGNRNQRRRRLDPKADADLRRQVLERDGWRCQSCGRTTQLQVHHLRFRSRSGEDAEHNLITLCADCHREIHLRGRVDWLAATCRGCLASGIG